MAAPVAPLPRLRGAKAQPPRAPSTSAPVVSLDDLSKRQDRTSTMSHVDGQLAAYALLAPRGILGRVVGCILDIARREMVVAMNVKFHARGVRICAGWDWWRTCALLVSLTRSFFLRASQRDVIKRCERDLPRPIVCESVFRTSRSTPHPSVHRAFRVPNGFLCENESALMFQVASSPEPDNAASRRNSISGELLES